MKYSKVTNKDIQQISDLIVKYGYWSNEVRLFNDNYINKKGYDTFIRLENKVRLKLK